MKSKRRQIRAEQVRTEHVRAGQVRAEEKKTSGNDQGRREIQSFLRALYSYPARFSKEPDVTFEQHRIRLQRINESVPRRRA